MRIRTLLALAALAAAASPAAAHHPMGGALPVTAVQGLLGGLAHPVLGLDHLAFVLGVGLLAARFRHGLWLPLAFLIGGAAGAAVHMTALALPAAEWGVVLSVLVLAAVVIRQKPTAWPLLAGFFAAAGLFHGYALAETIIGAERAPLFAYLAGLVATQYAISAAVMLAYRWVAAARPHTAWHARVAVGCGAAAVAMVSLLQQGLG